VIDLTLCGNIRCNLAVMQLMIRSTLDSPYGQAGKSLRRAILLVLACLSTLPALAGKRHGGNQPQPLFNGKDLAGWQGAPECWSVIDGVLTDRNPVTAAKDGIIALQIHAGPPMKAEFRNILLTDLKPSDAEPNPTP